MFLLCVRFALFFLAFAFAQRLASSYFKHLDGLFNVEQTNGHFMLSGNGQPIFFINIYLRYLHEQDSE